MNKSNLLNKLKNYKNDNAQKYGILSIGVFGSFARNQVTESSDVDIVVQIETPDPFILVHIKEDLEAQLHMPVDIVRFREKMNPFLRNRIEKEALYV
ncbi:MAG: nucleotidyltransferase domain-containing protein [Deltaproteobacteria bacterium]|nr:nucleotidyltransferase domain-containing protein [Candidatus Tharpella aukensis]